MSIKLIIKLCVFTLLFWSFYFSNSPMEWTKRHDTMLFREVLVVNPYQAKKKTVQRGQLWQTVAGNLVQLEDPVFKKSLSKRSVQDRCTLLCEKHKKRMKYETKASGISPNVTELDNLIEETLEKEEASEELSGPTNYCPGLPVTARDCPRLPGDCPRHCPRLPG